MCFLLAAFLVLFGRRGDRQWRSRSGNRSVLGGWTWGQGLLCLILGCPKRVQQAARLRQGLEISFVRTRDPKNPDGVALTCYSGPPTHCGGGWFAVTLNSFCLNPAIPGHADVVQLKLGWVHMYLCCSSLTVNLYSLLPRILLV